MSKELPVNNVNWVEETCQFSEDFIKNCNKDNYIGCFI